MTQSRLRISDSEWRHYDNASAALWPRVIFNEAQTLWPHCPLGSNASIPQRSFHGCWLHLQVSLSWWRARLLIIDHEIWESYNIAEVIRSVTNSTAACHKRNGTMNDKEMQIYDDPKQIDFLSNSDLHAGIHPIGHCWNVSIANMWDSHEMIPEYRKGYQHCWAMSLCAYNIHTLAGKLP